jgi:hypothetical protein
MRRIFALAIGGIFLAAGAGSASAQTCPGAVGTPWGGDDSGVLTCDKTAVACENKVDTALSVLVKAMIKCHVKQADAVFKGKPAFDEEACESTAKQSFVTKNSTVVGAGCSCIVPGGLSNLWETVLDTNNSLVYCDGWETDIATCVGATPVDVTGEDTGCAAASPDEQKCQDKVWSCVASLVKNWGKCHQTNAKAFAKNGSYDEDACEDGPLPGKPGKAAIEQFNSCVAKAGVGTPGGSCEACNATNLPTILGLLNAQLDGGNDQIYCMP